MSQPQLWPIFLDAGALNWRVFGKNDSDTEFVAARERIIRRDASLCRYCGFRGGATEHIKNTGIEIHAIDGDGNNLKDDNLAVACNLCRMCFNLEYAGEQGAILAYVPEISQALINNLVRSVLFLRYYIENERRKAAEVATTTLQGRAAQNAAKLVETAARASIAAGGDPENVRLLLPLLNGAEGLFAALKARASDAEAIIGTARPEVLGRAIISIRTILDSQKDEQLSASAASVSMQIREKFAEFLPPDAKEPAPGRISSDAETPDLDDTLRHIRVIPTQPGCDPRAWGPPTGSYMTSLPKVWIDHYGGMLVKLKEEGLTLDLPVVKPKTAGTPDDAAGKEAPPS